MIEGAGGILTDWEGHKLNWKASANSLATSMISFPILLLIFIIPYHVPYLILLICTLKLVNVPGKG